MRTVLVLLLAVGIGASAGVGMAVWRFGTLPPGQELPPLVPASAPSVGPDTEGPAPKLSVEQTEFDFGVMDLDAEMSHDFVFGNMGNGPLKLVEGNTSCRCTLSEIDAEEIPPGGQAKVTLTWHGNEAVGPYRQTATIFTNDPARPRVDLVVSGRITATARIVPDELVFSQISAGETATATIPLYGYLEQPLDVTGFELDRPDTAELFDVSFEPLKPELLEEEAGAQSGVLVKVSAKPGLPLGAFRQTIRVKTNLADAPQVDIPIKGTVTSDIMVVGPDWNNEYGLLDIGTVASHEGAQRRLLLIARGPYRERVSFKPVEVSPDLLQVKLGETKAINNGLVYQTTLTVDIPKGSPRANHLGSEEDNLGEILLETGHPKARQLRIRIRFAVQG